MTTLQAPALALLLTELTVAAAGMVLVGLRVLPLDGVWRVGRRVLAAGVMVDSMALLAPLGVLITGTVGLLIFAAVAPLLHVPTAEQRAGLRRAGARELPRVRR